MIAGPPVVAGVDVRLSFNLISDVRQLLEYHFMTNALWAATATAVLAGVAGWLMVLRGQTFAGHALSVMAFPGAAGATWLGVSPLGGAFVVCVAAAAVIGAVPRRTGSHPSSDEPVVIAVVLAFALASGFLFASLASGFLGGVNALLFGTFLGVTDTQVLVLVAVAGATLVVLGVVGRPLLFASLDPAVAEAGGVPVTRLAVAYLVLLGVTVAEVSLITGALLVFALLVMPAAAARQLVARPGWGVVLSVVIGVGVAWLGLGLSYFSSYPAGFYITTCGFGVYVLAAAARRLVTWAGRRPGVPLDPGAGPRPAVAGGPPDAGAGPRPAAAGGPGLPRGGRRP